jgi:FtsH-binding integral membrane protein
MFRFLPGLILIQIATVALAYAAFSSDFDSSTLLALGGISLLFTFFAAFWFTSIARQMHDDQMHRVRHSHAQEREKIRVDAEKQKAKIIAESQREIERRVARAQARANFRAGVAFAVVVGAGAMLILTHFITAGVLTLAAGGGAVFGYATRVRQEMRSRTRALPEMQKTPHPAEMRKQQQDKRPLKSISVSAEKQIREE